MAGTSLHTLEDAIPDFKYPVYYPEIFDFEVIDYEGSKHLVKTKVHDPEYSVKRKCDDLIPHFINDGVMEKVKVGEADTLLADAKGFFESMVKWYREKGVTMYTPNGGRIKLKMTLNIPSPTVHVEHPLFKANDLTVLMKRDDLIHPEISGNKWRKLKLNVEKYKHNKYDSILTFGGAYSNHIAATAAVGNAMGISTIGVIRGEELTPVSNATLEMAAAHGMQLNFVSRADYQYRYERWYWEDLRNQFGNCLIVPEGGANLLGALGCAEILNELDFEPRLYGLSSRNGYNNYRFVN